MIYTDEEETGKDKQKRRENTKRSLHILPLCVIIRPDTTISTSGSPASGSEGYPKLKWIILS